MITITIITCTYNAASVLQRTLDSVLCQTYQHVEHLIVDGCSKDATLQMASSYKALSGERHTGHSVLIHSERDKGLYDAMNKALGMATGDYLVYLNAGDTLPSCNTLQKVACCAEGAERLPALIYGDTDVVDDDGRFLCHRRLSPPEHLSWRDFRNGMLVCHQAFYALTSIARATPYNIIYKYSADVDWCIRVMKEGEKQQRPLHNAHAVLVNFLDGGMTTAHHRASLIERFRVMSSHYGLLRTILQHLYFVWRAVTKR